MASGNDVDLSCSPTKPKISWLAQQKNRTEKEKVLVWSLQFYLFNRRKDRTFSVQFITSFNPLLHPRLCRGTSFPWFLLSGEKPVSLLSSSPLSLSHFRLVLLIQSLKAPLSKKEESSIFFRPHSGVRGI